MVQKYWTSLVQLERIATIYGCHKDKLKKGTLEIQHLFMKKASSSSWRGRVKVFFFKTPGGDSLYKIIPPTQSTPWKDVSNAKAARQSLAFSQQPKRYCAASDVSPTWWLCERTFLKPMEFFFKTPTTSLIHFSGRNGEMLMASSILPVVSQSNWQMNNYHVALDKQ